MEENRTAVSVHAADARTGVESRYRELLAGLQQQPDDLELLYSIAQLTQQLGDLESAKHYYLRLLKLAPKFSDGFSSLGMILHALHDLPGALQAFQKSVELAPTSVHALNNLANVQQEFGEFDSALELYNRAILLEPKEASAYNNRGCLLAEIGREAEAVRSYLEAVKLKPDYGDAHYNLAGLYDRLGELDQAYASYKTAFELRPESPAIAAAMLHRRQHLCQWADIESEAETIVANLESNSLPFADLLVPPFSHLCLPTPTSPEQQRLVAHRWSLRYVRPPQPFYKRFPSLPPHTLDANASRRIRVGFLSGDFFNHATTWLIAEAIETHDRRNFELFGYSTRTDQTSTMLRRMSEAFEHFRDLEALPHQAAAMVIAADQLDILIDLKGFTQNSRPQILAYRPAPIQVNFLGYPGTMGADFIDYALVDSYIVPPDRQATFAEQAVYLPGCYQPNDSNPVIHPIASKRSDFGLPDDAVVCCSFNNPYKHTPRVFAIWMRFLKSQPRAVLWLFEQHAEASKNLRAFAEASGVDPRRLIFSVSIEHAKHLERLRHADLFLDSFPVNAHTTAGDALRMGVPILTLSGRSFISRVAGSLLKHLGLDKCITESYEAYEARGLEWLREPSRLAELRSELQSRLASTDLFDGKAFARKLEAAYRFMLNDRARRHDEEGRRLHQMGNELFHRGEFEQAAQAFEAWSTLNPTHPAGYLNIGVCREKLGDQAQLQRIYEAGIAACPNDARLYHQLGRVFQQQNHFDEAVRCFQHAVQLNPNQAESYLELGTIESMIGSPDSAADLCKRAIELNPNGDESVVAHRMQHVCRFEEAEVFARRAVENVLHREDPNYSAHPFAFVCLPNATGSLEQLRCAERWAKLHHYDVRRVLPSGRPGRVGRANQRLRIGYLSSDFYDHATGWLIAEMLEEHDRQGFEIFLYSFGPDDGTEIRSRIVAAGDVFRECRRLNHVELAQQIADDKIDILVDLKGYTRNARVEVLTYRPAPIQVTYLGFPGTLGIDCVDYNLVDSYVVPEDRRSLYREKLFHLPGCYQVNDSRIRVADWSPTRTECRLPEAAIVCCSFNTPFKLTSSMFQLWLRLLGKHPSAVLWMLDDGQIVSDRLRSTADANGIAPNRLIFADRIEHGRHLARLSLADLFLDSFPVNGHTTVSDAVRMGVPVLTLSGEAFISRVAGSVLSHLGMPELIATSHEEYETKADLLLQQPARLHSLRMKLGEQLKQTDLFDGRAFARKIEAAYRTMWQTHLAQPETPR